MNTENKQEESIWENFKNPTNEETASKILDAIKEQGLFVGKSPLDEPISGYDLEEERKALAEIPFSKRLSITSSGDSMTSEGRTSMMMMDEIDQFDSRNIVLNASKESIKYFEDAIRDELESMIIKNKK